MYRKTQTQDSPVSFNLNPQDKDDSLPLSKIRLEAKLSLRKKKHIDSKVKERLQSRQNQSSSNYEIDLSSLPLINQSLCTQFYSPQLTNENRILYLFNQFHIWKSDENLLKFSIKQIRNYLESIDSQLRTNDFIKKINSILPKEFIFFLIEYINSFGNNINNDVINSNNCDLKLLYEISKILIVISYNSNEKDNVLLNILVDNINTLYNIMIKYEGDKIIYKNILFIIGNLLCSNDTNFNIIISNKSFNIVDYVFKKIESCSKLLEKNMDNICNIFWLYKIIFTSSPTIEENILENKCFDHMPIISQFISLKFDYFLYLDSLKIIQIFLSKLLNKRMTKQISELDLFNEYCALLDEMNLEKSILDNLKEINLKEFEYIACSFNILTSLSTINVYYTEKMIECGITKIIENTLEVISSCIENGEYNNNIDTITEELLNLIFIFAKSKEEQLEYELIKNSKILKLLIEFIKKKLLVEYWNIILCSIKCICKIKNSRINLELINLDVPELMVEMLDLIESKNYECVNYALKAIIGLLEYDKVRNDNNKKMMLINLEKMGARSKLEKISMMGGGREDIKEMARGILEEYFSKTNDI